MKPVLLTVICAVLCGFAASASDAADWPTYGFSLKREAYNPDEHTIGPGNAATLEVEWSKKLSGGITAQPVVADRVAVDGKELQLAYIGTEHGDFYAVNAATGRIVWQRHLGTMRLKRCPENSPDGLVGVTGTAAIDRHAGVVYAVGGDSRAYALDLATGAVRKGWPISLGLSRTLEHVWGGLTLSHRKLYIGSAGDGCATPLGYGRVIRIDVDTRQVAAWYASSEPGGPVHGAGVWSWAGLSVGSGSNDLFLATGNDLGKDESAEYGEHVVRLRPNLSVAASNHPTLKGFDVDFGSTPVLFTAPGCPQQAVVENKSGVLMVYRTSAIGAGPVQALKVSKYVPGGELIGNAAYSPLTNTVYVSSPTDLPNSRYEHGLLAFQVGTDCRLSLRWQRTVGQSGIVVSSPTVANGVVYYGDGPGNTLRAFDAKTGSALWESNVTIGGPIFGAPSVVNGRVLVGSWDGKLYAFGPRDVPVAETEGGATSSSRPWMALIGLAAAALAARMAWRLRAARRMF